jgi:hypothetical protein
MSPTYLKVNGIKDRLIELKKEIRKYEEDPEYKEYCEGVIDAAIRVLEVIAP